MDIIINEAAQAGVEFDPSAAHDLNLDGRSSEIGGGRVRAWGGVSELSPLPHNGWMRWRRVAVIGGVIALAASASAVGWGLLAYNEVTKVDRTDPQVVTDQFLRAVLVRKDHAGAELYACRDESRNDDLWALRNDLDKRERDFNVTIIVSWGAYAPEGSDLRTSLTITANRDGIEQSSSVQVWRIHLVEEGGWRVCGADRVEGTLPT